MSKAQRWIILVSGVVTLGMLLFPPWYAVSRRGTVGGYRFLFDLHPVASVSWGRLVLQLVSCWVIAGGVWFIRGTRDKSD